MNTSIVVSVTKMRSFFCALNDINTAIDDRREARSIVLFTSESTLYNASQREVLPMSKVDTALENVRNELIILRSSHELCQCIENEDSVRCWRGAVLWRNWTVLIDCEYLLVPHVAENHGE